MKKIASAFCMTLAVLWLRLGQTDTVENEPEVIVGFKGGGEKEKITNHSLASLQCCQLAEWLVPTRDDEQEEGHERAKNKEDDLEEEEGGDRVRNGRKTSKDDR